jgi:hypothetical protein
VTFATWFRFSGLGSQGPPSPVPVREKATQEKGRCLRGLGHASLRAICSLRISRTVSSASKRTRPAVIGDVASARAENVTFRCDSAARRTSQ